jgi:hypothetical protein
MKLTMETLALATIITGLFLAVVISATIMTNATDSPDTKLSLGTQDTLEKPNNIRSSAPTPSSCTATQNCGQQTCAASRGGSCGCGRR